MVLIPYAGGGTPGFTNGHRRAEALLNCGGLVGSTVAMDGTIYFCESYNRSVRKIEGNNVSVVAGDPTQEGSRDGHVLRATFSMPASIAYSETRKTIYVLDLEKGSIRAIKDGWVTTLICGDTYFPTTSSNESWSRMILSFSESRLICSGSQDTVLYEVDLTKEGEVEASPIGWTRCSIFDFVSLPDDSILATFAKGTNVIHLIPSIAHVSAEIEAEQTRRIRLHGHHQSLPAIQSELLRHQPRLVFIPSGLEITSSWPSLSYLTYSHLQGDVAFAGPSGNGMSFSETKTISYWSGLNLMPLVHDACPKELSGDVTFEIWDGDYKRSYCVHSQILQAHDIDPTEFSECMSLSGCDAQCVQQLLQILYMTPFEWFNTLSPTLQTAISVIQLHQTCIKFGFPTYVPERALEVFILPFLPMVQLSLLFQTAIHTNDPLLDLLARSLIPHYIDFVDYTKTAPEWSLILEAEKACQLVLPLGSPYHPFEETKTAPIPLKLLELGIILGSCIEWRRRTEETLPLPNFFRFVIAGTDLQMDVPYLFLYGGWSYFRAVVHSGLAESRTRVFELQADFPPSLLEAIMRSLHGLPLHKWIQERPEIWLYAIEHGPLYGLTSTETNDIVAPFHSLVHFARQGLVSKRHSFADTLMDDEYAWEPEDDDIFEDEDEDIDFGSESEDSVDN
jgi:hypothetical protein